MLKATVASCFGKLLEMKYMSLVFKDLGFSVGTNVLGHRPGTEVRKYEETDQPVVFDLFIEFVNKSKI